MNDQPSASAAVAADKLILSLANYYGDVAKLYTPLTCSTIAVALDKFATAERANIVAWLHIVAEDTFCEESEEYKAVCDAADCIERGDHSSLEGKSDV